MLARITFESETKQYNNAHLNFVFINWHIIEVISFKRLRPCEANYAI